MNDFRLETRKIVNVVLAWDPDGTLAITYAKYLALEVEHQRVVIASLTKERDAARMAGPTCASCGDFIGSVCPKCGAE